MRAIQDHLGTEPIYDEATRESLIRHLSPWAKEAVESMREAKRRTKDRKKGSPGTHTRKGMPVG